VAEWSAVLSRIRKVPGSNIGNIHSVLVDTILSPPDGVAVGDDTFVAKISVLTSVMLSNAFLGDPQSLQSKAFARPLYANIRRCIIQAIASIIIQTTGTHSTGVAVTLWTHIR
jgi:hypothetical protein